MCNAATRRHNTAQSDACPPSIHVHSCLDIAIISELCNRAGPHPVPRLPRGRGAHVATWRDRDAGTVSLRGGTCDRVGGAAAACPSLVAIHTSQNVLLEKISHDPIPSNQKEITIVSPIFKMTLPGGAGSRHDVRKSAKRPLASLSLLIMKHSDYKLTAG